MKRSILSVTFLAAFVLLAMTTTAVAVGTISLDPSVIRLTMRPGEIWRGQVSVTNGTDQVVSLSVSTANVSGVDADAIDLAEDVAERIGTLAAWLKPGASALRLNAGEAGLLYFSVQVPDNASPGSHRGLIMLSRTPEASGGNVLGTSAAIALGVDLTVVGQSNHHVALGDLIVSPRFGTKPPVTVLATVVNTGNTLPTMRMVATVSRLWGNSARVVMTPDNGSAKVAPGSSSLFRGAWEGSGLTPIGIFRVRVTAADSSAVYEDSRWLILLPWQGFLGIGAALVVILWGRRFWPRFVRKRRRRL